MRLSFAGDRVLAVMAHPDDAELLCAGTLARARADGAAIAICIMCDGDKGLPPASVETPSAQQMVETRRREAQDAAKLLGAELFWFGSPDGELIDGIEPRLRMVEIFRQFRPTLVLAHAAEDYHADHRAAGALAEAASWFCASRGHRTASEPLGSPPALWFADTIGGGGFRPEFYVDVSQFLELKRRMLRCHRSQLTRGNDGDFAPLEELMSRQAALRGTQANVAAAEAFRQHHAFKRASGW